MVVIFKRDESDFSKGQLIPLVELPVGQEGEKLDLNDFQWWAPTDKWEGWLKANPREWQAESEEPIYKKSDEEIFESLTEEGIIDPSVVDFEEFSKLMEDENAEGSTEATADDEKRYTKFVFAYNQLLKDGKIISDISLKKLGVGEEYALILDLQDENEKPIEQTRNAYKFKILASSEESKLIIGEITESLLGGQIEEGTSLAENFIKVGKMIGGLAIRGVFTLGAVAVAAKVTVSLLGRVKWLKTLMGIKNAKKGWSIFKNIKTMGGIIPFTKAAVNVIRSGKVAANVIKGAKAGKRLVDAGKGLTRLANAAKAGSAAAKGSNPIGWIITATMAVQQTYNWLSSKQAPRLGQIEDEGIEAHNKFSPGSIPDGSAITVCWTQEAGQSSISGALMSIIVANDTRTTMNLLKIGNFKGEALFYLISINSEMYSQMLKENPTIFLSFPETKTFNGSGGSWKTLVDNDDIVGKMIIPPGGADGGVSAFFQGYCGWDEIKKAFDDADDEMIRVSPNAPDEYSFHFKSSDTGRDVNVVGDLVKDLTDIDKVKATFASTEEVKESEFYPSDGVLSFSEFNSFSLNEGYLDYEMLSEEESAQVAEATEKAEETKLTETQEIAVYEVKEIKFADPAFEGETLPDLTTFIIPNDYLEAEDNTPIKVEPIQEVETKNPRRGTITIETEIAEDPILAPTGGTGDEGGETVTGGVPTEVTKGEIKIKHRDNPDYLNSIGLPDIDKIKDKDKDDTIKLLDFITPEEKEQLGMENWEYIKKVKIYREGKTGDPYMIKFKSGGAESDRKRKIKSSDPAFETALKVAERIKAGFKQVDSSEEGEED